MVVAGGAVLSSTEHRALSTEGSAVTFRRDRTVMTDIDTATATARFESALMVSGALTEVFRLSVPPGSNQSFATLMITDGDSVNRFYRVRVGANDTGPGGAGRALWIDNQP